MLIACGRLGTVARENRSGQWTETGTVEALTTENLKTRLRQTIGAGYSGLTSGLTVANGKLYLSSRNNKPRQIETIHCYDAKSETPVRDVKYPSIYTVGCTAGPRISITVDDNRAIALGAMGVMNCFKSVDGAIIWKKNLNAAYRISASKRTPIWGIACSPIVYGDLVVIVIVIVVGVGGEQGTQSLPSTKRPETKCGAPLTI